jgi:Tfp pilus assembly protein PilX
MKNFNYKTEQNQRGAILIIALMFLVAITLLTVSSMRSSKIGLHMAQNEESRIAAVQAAQALADAIVANPASTPVVGTTGFITCTAGQYGCNRNDLPVSNAFLSAAVDAAHLNARVERTGTVFRPPPRIVESSIDKFSSASFRVTTVYDRVDDGLGRQQITEGVLVLIPKQ